MTFTRLDPRAILLTSCCLLSVAGCTSDDAGGDGDVDTGSVTMGDETGDPAPFDEAEVIGQASDYATTLTKINVDAFGSMHGLADTVNVFVSPDIAQLYRGIDPDAPAEVAFPEGALIVKEHLDAEGAFAGFTMMYRGPDGYDPLSDSWFWALVDADGVTQQSGAIGLCIGCHEPASSFVFGVPADNQM